MQLPPSPASNLSIITKISGAYKLWHGFITTLPRASRYTIGTKIDILFTETMECILIASYSQRGDKISLLEKSAQRLDLLKFFLQIAWELKAIDTNKYTAVSAPLSEVGKMLGGWRKQAEKILAPKQNSLPRKWQREMK